MSSNLQGFFKENAIKTESIKYVASERFLDENKKPIEWEIIPVSSEIGEELKKQAMKRVQIKRGVIQNELDGAKYACLLAAACTAYPNLNDVDLQNSYGAMSAEELLKKMLLQGEYTNYLGKIEEICAFDKNINDLVEEAKN